jgi:hypothetical protein
MSKEYPLGLEARMQQAIAELESAILQRYPGARFEVSVAADDPRQIHLNAVVDLDDPDEVGDLVLDRLLQLQVDEGIPLHVIPLRTPERIEAAAAAERSAQRLPSARPVPFVGGHPAAT